MAKTSQKPLKIFVIAGETSGDQLGAGVLAALKAQYRGAVAFEGVGGSLMEEQGLQSLFPMDDLSVMGIFEILPRLTKLLRRIDQTVQAIIKSQPDIVITIDSPDFCFRVVAALQKKMTPLPRLFHYVAPTVWAWRAERAKKVAALYDGIICLYPFEPDYFIRENMRACFVGHPVISLKKQIDENRSSSEIEGKKLTVGFLPGSRQGEIKKVGPVLLDSLKTLYQKHPHIHVKCLTLPHRAAQIEALMSGYDGSFDIVCGKDDKARAFAAMDIAVATSGTIGLELSVADIPHVIGYKMNGLTWALISKRLTTKYAHLTNILLNKPAVPEFIQHDCEADKITNALMHLVESENARHAQKQSFQDARALLTGQGDKTPSVQAADFILADF